MKNTFTLKHNKDFKRLYFNARYKTDSFIVTYIMKNYKDFNRIGITVSKKIGNSVVRNRAKRIIKAAYFNLESSLPLGYDFVFVARKNIVMSNSNQIMLSIKKQMDFLLKILK